MTRSILLTAAFAALTASVAPSVTFADDLADNEGEISNDLLAQFGLGDSEVVSDEEGLEIRGKLRKSPSDGRTITVKPLGKKSGRKQRRKLTKGRRFVAKKLKPGRYSVSYKAVAKRGSRPAPPSKNAPPVRVSVPGRR